VSGSDEHDEEGHVIEDAGTRTAMVLKYLRKLGALSQEMGAPQTWGGPGAEVTLIGWGSTYSALGEVVDVVGRDGLKTNLIHMTKVWPHSRPRFLPNGSGRREDS